MEILYSDRDIVVAIKPRGVLSEQGEGNGDSMPALLAPEFGRVYPVHRLDRAVGGVMVYARHSAAAAALSRAVADRALQKEYTAVIAGSPDAPEGEWEDLLYHDARSNKTFVVDRERKGAKKAILRYLVTDQAEYEGAELSRVKIRLLTGRSHQIRVQFASRALPLVGDGKYGSRIKAPFLALAATSLTFPHPKSGKPMSFVAPTPSDFPWALFGEAHYEIERKFLIAYPDPAALQNMQGCRVRRITQTYLLSPAGVTDRVREIREGEEVRYIRTTKRRVSSMRAIEEEKELTLAEYGELLAQADPARVPILKTRYAFPYDKHIVEVDLFDAFQDRALAEIELESESEEALLPPELKLVREVTDDPRYKNVNLAKNISFED